jgi:cytochrome P450
MVQLSSPSSLPSWLELDVSLNYTCLVVGLLSVVHFVWCRYQAFLETKTPFPNLPMPPGSHWFLGHLRQMGGDFRVAQFRMGLEHCNPYGQTGFWLLSRRSVTVTRCDDARTVVNNSNSRRTIGLFRWHADEFLGARSIALLNGKEWKFHRTAVARAFTPTAVAEAHSGILRVVSTLLSSLRRTYKDDEDIVQDDILGLMKMITIDVFGQTTLSTDLGCCRTLQPSRLAVAFDYMGTELSRRMFQSSPWSVTDLFYWIPTPANVRYKQGRKHIRDFLDNLVRDRLRMSPKNRPHDLLSHLLHGTDAISNDDGGDEDDDTGTKDADCKNEEHGPTDGRSERAISDVLMGLLFAGYDTSSITLTYALYHIATSPDVETICLAEIEQADGTDPDSLVYCRAVLLETLRLYPPAPSTSRNLEKPLKLSGGIVLPPDTLCFIPIWTIQRMEEHYERPNEFHPKRWVRRRRNDTKTGVWEERFEDDADSMAGDDEEEEDDIAPANRKAFLAFSGGARSCVGMKFAMAELVLVFSQLIKHFSFECSPNYELCPLRIGLIQQPRDKIAMTMKWRQK